MIRLEVPQIDHQSLFTTCVGYVQSDTTRTALNEAYPEVADNVTAYNSRAAETLFEIEPKTFSDVQRIWLKNFYTYYVVGGRQRRVYDLILASATLGICPYCAQRDAQTLDHYLPKSAFPEFAILAQNLVPCCTSCNGEKGEHRPKYAGDQVFHPYFDDWNHPELLKASLEVGTNVVVTFEIGCTSQVDADILARASKHFEIFELGTLYSIHAGVELVNSKREFREAAESSGPNSLQRELLGRMSRVIWPRHSWRRSLYRELASNSAFLNGGYEFIDEP